VVAAIRVHGNHTTPEADVLRLVGPVVGQPASDALVLEVADRLERSGRFAGVDVRRRYLSIDDPTAVLLVIVVDERPGVREDDLTPGPWRRVTSSGMWLPVLGYQEGYGFTYGARIGFVDLVGPRTRISVPLTWGGERQARVEIERSFTSRWVGRVAGGGGILRRENPYYELGDTRQDLWARVEAGPASWLRFGADTRLADVSFGDLNDRLSTFGADVTVDTRVDPAFPRNAVYGAFRIERLGFSTGSTSLEPARGDAPSTSTRRTTTDARAYVGVYRQVVFALRGQLVSSSDALPVFEHSLLGGIPSLRGSDVGSQAADNLAAASGEFRVPLTAPGGLGRLGVKVFADAGTVYAAGASLANQRFAWGYGAGVFLDATVFSAGADVGWPEQGGGPNLHVHLGVRLGR
jgi:outer membrane protein assembly factor BamA